MASPGFDEHLRLAERREDFTVEQLIAEHRVSTVIVAATDPAGVVRGKRLTVPYFRKAVEGGVKMRRFRSDRMPIRQYRPKGWPNHLG